MDNKILGLDLGTNSVGWALFEGDENNVPIKLIDLGVRIFRRAVEDKTPTPKNQARRNARMARRIIQRRSRRKQRMLHYLVSLDLLPKELSDHTQPEIILNKLGDPYALRAKALDNKLEPHELGRVLLHLVQRRGFQSNRKTLLGDMADDPDTLAVLSDETDCTDDKEETDFKKDISNLREKIIESGSRTLGEYLHQLPDGHVKRNRKSEGGKLRTDRQMYKDEFWAIVNTQRTYYPLLEDAQEELFEIIFFQRPLKLKKDRVGKCSLEPQKRRAKKAWRLFQRYRYLQDINSLRYFDSYTGQWNELNSDEREKLIKLFEKKAKPTVSEIKKLLGFSKNQKLNFDRAANKSFKGNLTEIPIRAVFPRWDTLSDIQKDQLEEDLITFESKKALKNRLLNHWDIDKSTAIQLCLLEFEPEYSDLSLKAIRKLLPFLQQGLIYSDARQMAGYDYESKKITVQEKLETLPDIPNPVVMRGLHELKRVVNAVINEYGKPTAIRLEMARDLEMSTKRYKAFTKQQKQNTKLNEEAQRQFEAIAKKNTHLGLSKYASRTDKIKYRLWQEQEYRCAYSNQQIALTELFTGAVEIDHILPYSLTLNDSYMNKVVCFASENQAKGQRTPREAFEADEGKWEQIEGAISHWYQKNLSGKRDAFYKVADDLNKDFISSQLTDTRYISREALHFLRTLGMEVNTVKGQVTSWLRHIWGMNSLIDEKKSEKDRTDHRHHAIDAAVIACIDRSLQKSIVKLARDLERLPGTTDITKMHLDPRFDGFREQIRQRLDEIIIAHTPERKISGALHEDTGIGFIEGIGTVYRKDINGDIKSTEIKKIVDPVVRKLVEEHLNKHGGVSKTAFSSSNPVFHHDGRTPIKRVRIIQAKGIKSLEELENNKLGIKNKQGKVFKWMTLGNYHHVEIFRNKVDGKYKPQYVSMLEAISRAQQKQSIVSRYLNESHEFIMALHKNDLVSVNHEGMSGIYRVQKLGGIDDSPVLRWQFSSTSNEKEQAIRKSFGTLITDYQIHPIYVNAIGKRLDDQANY